MTTRDRFNRVLHWRRPDRVPNMEFGYWEKTLPVWWDQGLPRDLSTNEAVERYLGLEGLSIIPEAPAEVGLFPAIPEEVLEERNGRRIVRNKDGVLCEKLDYDSTMPRFLKFPIETREDWERFREERLDPSHPGRVGDIKAAVAATHADGMPVHVHGGSLYGRLRNWMGLEALSVALLTKRDWVEEMMEHLTRLAVAVLERALPRAEIDVAWWWEDMCYGHGPLISPRLFEELMVPRYKRITDLLRRHGVDVNILDCDGRIYELVPGWLRAGITCMFPVEALHTDPWRLREEYGERVLLIGGVDKRALIAGRDAIDRELEKLHPLVERGGYIPCVDHRVPPDVTYENYLYYLEKKQAIL